MEPFEVRDCALLIRMSGLPAAYNLRELRERLSSCSPDVLYYHFCETPLVPSFDNPDYRNDFAVWVKQYLGDRVLAERLGILDPYGFESMEGLRSTVLDLIDERLSELSGPLWAAPGSEFFFLQATTMVFDTGERIDRVENLGSRIQRMTNSSVYFHFLEARRRTPLGIDDFTVWLLKADAQYEAYVRALAAVDFTFYSLSELRQKLVEVLATAGAQS